MKTGLVLSRCTDGLAKVVNEDELLSSLKAAHPDVSITLAACLCQTTEPIEQAIREHRLERVVVSACIGSTALQRFGDALERLGLDRQALRVLDARAQAEPILDRHAASGHAARVISDAVLKERP